MPGLRMVFASHTPRRVLVSIVKLNTLPTLHIYHATFVASSLLLVLLFRETFTLGDN